MNKVWWIAGALMIMAPALARPPHGGEERDPAVMVAKMTEQLGLSEDQADTVEAILVDAQAEGRSLREKAGGLVDELRAERASAEPSVARMEKLIRQIGAIRTDGEVLRMRTMQEVLASLPADKAARLKAHLLERGDGAPEGL
jgi:hypothetical protein